MNEMIVWRAIQGFIGGGMIPTVFATAYIVFPRSKMGSSRRPARMPEIGKTFYETGPAFGIARVARYLKDQVTTGLLAIEDCELAAAQFLDSCQSTTFKPMLFNASEPPSEERIDHVVTTAVRTFLAAYRR